MGVASGGTANISSCFNTGTVTQNGNKLGAGGIIGMVISTTININDCYNTNTISGQTMVGGIMGCITTSNANAKAIIKGCYNIGLITANTSVKGGIVGTINNGGGNSYKSEVEFTRCIWSDKNKAGTALPTGIYGAVYDASKVTKDTVSAQYALTDFTNSNFNSTGNNGATLLNAGTNTNAWTQDLDATDGYINNKYPYLAENVPSTSEYI